MIYFLFSSFKTNKKGTADLRRREKGKKKKKKNPEKLFILFLLIYDRRNERFKGTSPVRSCNYIFHLISDEGNICNIRV